ncbi:MAG: S1 RNA-binding domain-containing protein, partial [Endomicrobiaceae bacterium]|nr:S1 RNA-binding domain-containing protein [Endomicrobiaceae bacterium]
VDPRKDFSSTEFSAEINSIEDLKEDMVLDGTVTNVTNFGAFVDIGVHQDGLVHISKLSSKFVSNPHDVISVGETVKVRVIKIDTELSRISLERI